MKARNWKPGREKVEGEGRCRFCLSTRHGLDSAHIIPRSLNPSDENMDARGIVPLCRLCHTRFDSHDLDILKVLTVDEQAWAVQMANGIENARQIITGVRL